MHLTCLSLPYKWQGLGCVIYRDQTTTITYIKVVGRWHKLFHFLLGEDIRCHEMTLGVTVLAGFGS